MLVRHVEERPAHENGKDKDSSVKHKSGPAEGV